MVFVLFVLLLSIIIIYSVIYYTYNIVSIIAEPQCFILLNIMIKKAFADYQHKLYIVASISNLTNIYCAE